MERAARGVLRARQRIDEGAGGSMDGPLAGGSTRLGKSGRVPDVDDLDAIRDPAEREAVEKLQQAVRRIKASRDRRANPNMKGLGPRSQETRRDW